MTTPNGADLAEASSSKARPVISGHVDSFHRTPDGLLHKTTIQAEADMYRICGATEMRSCMPKLHSTRASPEPKKVIVTLGDMTHGVEAPCLMDVKMGERTFTEEEAAKAAAGGEVRADLLKKARAAATACPLPPARRHTTAPTPAPAPHSLSRALTGAPTPAQMLKVNKEAATPEELAAGGITKLRYLQFRDQSTTSTDVPCPSPCRSPSARVRPPRPAA
jgi:hypothetical protein